MKKNGFRKLNFLIAIGGIFAALALGSCENLLSSASSSDDGAPVNFFPPVGNVENGYGIVRGVLPQETSASTRSAMPDVPTIFSYQVFAQNGTTIIQANVDNASKTFSISLPYGTWNITANGLLANGRVVCTETQKNIAVSAEKPIVERKFNLSYSLNPDDGEGEMSLTVTFHDATSTITGIEYTLTKGGNSKTVAVDSADVAAGTFTIERTTEDLGTYNLTIKCYGDFNNLVYRIDEIVNVYANLITDKFVGSAPYISGGDIVITQAMLDEFQQATLYVNADPTIGNDSNNGTQFDPLRTFNRAVELVNNSTRSADTEFRIFLQSDVVDGAKLELKAGKKLTVANAGNTIHTITSLNGTFTVAATSTLIAQSMQFQKLRFVVDGTFEMNGGTISGNEVDDNGGAIYIKAGGQATISNGATISGNTTSLNGGGVYVDGGTFTMTGGEISDNTATGAGGAIYIKAGGQATITDGATISGNTATGGNGGGIFNIGTLAITDSTISNCTAGNAGSGICNSTMSASASITNCTISGCRGSTSSTYGGGIYVGGGTLSLDGCTIGGDSESDGCTAENGGGINIDSGTLTFTGSTTTIKNCTATTFGGGIYIKTSAAITNCAIELCKITATTGTVGGGGICNAGGTIAAPVTITGCTIKQCTSETQGYGGGIYNTGVLAISGGEITGCKSKSGGGGINNASAATLTVNNTTISDCECDAWGGGIYNGSAATATITDCTVESCSTSSAAGNVGGGGISNYGGTLTVSGGTIRNCTAEQTDGGGIYVSTGTLTMDGGTISDNIANESGGGVYVYNGTFTMNDGTISGNISRGTTEGSFGGGGIYIYRSTASASGGVFTMTGGTVSGNEAVYGGGIWGSNFSEIFLEGGTFSGNTAATSGQGAYVSPGCTFKMSGAASLVSNNGDNDVYLHGVKNSSTGAVMSYATITVAGALTATSPVATITSAIYEADQAVLSADTGLTITPTICSSFALSSAPAGMAELGITPDGTGTKGILKQSLLYVRGSGAGWYAENPAYIASAGNDANSGSKSAPFATIQKAIETAFAMNDGASEYTIWVDGTITGGTTATANGMGDISPTKALNLKIQSMSATTNATLDAEGSGRVLNINANAAVTLKNVNIANGNAADNGGGIYNSGTLTMEGGTISNCTAGTDGGGVYNYNTFIMNSGTISGNTATYGGGVHNSGTFTIKDGTISNNRATGLNDSGGGGIHLYNGSVTMEGGTISENEATGTTYDSGGGGIYIYTGKTFTMSGGTFSENKATKGNGAFVANKGTLNMSGAANFASDDDVYLYGVSTICVAGALTGTTPVATITPSAYTVGRQVLSGEATTLADNRTKFALSELGWIIDGNGCLAIMDIYVSSSGNDTAGNGTEAKPFATLQKAFGLLAAGTDENVSYTIHVSGTVTGSSTLAAGVKSEKILITGETGADTDILDGGGTAFIVLGVNCSVPVEIQNIKITGSTTSSGAYGICLLDANVTLGQGAVVSGNGGCGVNVSGNNGSTFTMEGGEISGNGNSGVHVVENGNSIFTMNGGTISNNRAIQGGGVFVRGTFIMNGGEISGNTASVDGGGVCIDDYATSAARRFTMSGGTIKKNSAASGGGVYDGGTFTMSGGTISENTVAVVGSQYEYSGKGGGVYVSRDMSFEMNGGTVSGNTASVNGGGICLAANGTFTMGGSASLPSATGAAKDNDVYLGSSNTIKISSELSAATPVATITPNAYSTSTQVLELASSSTTTIADNYQKFAVSPDSNGTEWYVTSVGKLAVSSYSLYVSQSGNNTTGNGTASAPYKTLQKAFDTIKTRNKSTNSYTVYISGTVSGTTTVASGLPAAKVLITGTSSASDILDGNSTGSVLTVNCTAPIEIKNVKITNGSATDGGGIVVTSGASLEMIGGTISDCTAVNRGGGVFVDSGTFKMSGTTEITNCTTTDSVTTSNGGGGIYIEGGTVEIAGGTISGCTAGRSGGGVCVHSNGTLTMTGGEITGNGNSSMTYGGGVYVNGGTFIMTNGSINANMAQMGAGVRLYNNSTIFTMSGGEIIGNTATDYCGGVYVNQGTFTITGGTITGNTGNGSGNKAGVYVLSGTFNNNGGTVQSD